MLSLIKSPNFITIARIVITPVLLVFIVLIPQGVSSLRWMTAVLFGVISLTDLLDGYLARRNMVVSSFGKCFDNIADKTLVAITLLGLVYIRKADIFPVAIILIREIIISGIREFLGSSGSSCVPVSLMSKYKTAVQMIAVFVLLASRRHGELMFFGNFILWISAIMSAFTLYDYLRIAIKKIDFVK